MATVKQREANQRNAQFSTGPKTQEGKDKVRLNPIKHGLRTEIVEVLPREDRTNSSAASNPGSTTMPLEPRSRFTWSIRSLCSPGRSSAPTVTKSRSCRPGGQRRATMLE